jgi:diaminohydroxyphosphoribosylaminopyrimidine deaminase/5-amino-6-(5-phosphoribosylamino)uracil reductase
VRLWNGRNPIRIALDKNLELPDSSHLFDQSQKTIIFNALKTDIKENIKFLELEDFDSLLPQLICYQLYLMDVQSILIEGGTKTLDLFIKAGLWDETRIFTGPENWDDGLRAPIISGTIMEEFAVGQDMLIIYKNQNR